VPKISISEVVISSIVSFFHEIVLVNTARAATEGQLAATSTRLWKSELAARAVVNAGTHD